MYVYIEVVNEVNETTIIGLFYKIHYFSLSTSKFHNILNVLLAIFL